MWNSESGPYHDRRTRASRRKVRNRWNTHAFPIATDSKISAGDGTARRTARGPAPTAGCLAELCSKCECYLRHEETEANEQDATSANRMGRCDDCYRKSLALIAPIGGPSHSFGTLF